MGAAFALLGLPIFGTVVIFWIIFLIVYILVSFIMYVFESFGLLRIAKKEKYKIPYIVWIPGISHYVLCRYCMSKIKSIIYAILSVINVIFIYCLMFGRFQIEYIKLVLIYMVIYFIINMLVMNTFYKKVYKKSELFTIFTVITFGFLKSIFIYLARIKKITKVDL